MLRLAGRESTARSKRCLHLIVYSLQFTVYGLQVIIITHYSLLITHLFSPPVPPKKNLRVFQFNAEGGAFAHFRLLDEDVTTVVLLDDALGQ